MAESDVAAQATLRATADGYELSGRIDFDNAEAVLQQGYELFEQGIAIPKHTQYLDLSKLTQNDTITVSVILAWYRRLAQSRVHLDVRKSPPGFARILRFTGLNEIWSDAAADVPTGDLR